VRRSVSSQNLAQFQAHQSETARIHTQYLHNEEEYARTFAQLTQSGLNLLANSSSAAPGTLEQLVTVLQGLERSDGSIPRSPGRDAAGSRAVSEESGKLLAKLLAAGIRF
jgi:hypothetical protein